MYLIREVFNTKPGKAKDLVKKFKQAEPFFKEMGEGKNHRIMTDITGEFWTVVIQYELEDIGGFVKSLRTFTPTPEFQEIMKGYIDLLEGGKREIYLIE